MSVKKGKNIAEELILDDLLDDEETKDFSISHQNDDSNVISLDIDDNSMPSLNINIEQSKSKNSPVKKELANFPIIPSSQKPENVSPKVPTSNYDSDETKPISGSSSNYTNQSVKSIPDGVSRTFVLNEDKNRPSKSENNEQVRQSVGRYSNQRIGGPISPTEVSLAQSENLKVAQSRIIELESRIESLRIENEQLAAAGDLFKKKSDELSSLLEGLEGKFKNETSSLSEEKEILKESLRAKDLEIRNLKNQNEELEVRLNSIRQKVRVRERELENRLELVRMEGTALVRSKDDLILDLKRQVDQMSMELDNFRIKGSELNKQIAEKQELLNRTVKALRISLTMLEGSDDLPYKKVK